MRAGEFETFLFVRGDAAVIEHVKRAWSGLWTERAIHNRAVLGVAAAGEGGGVLVQRIAWSRVSGVLQTENVVAGQYREMVLNVGLGMGEGIVSGAVGADQVVVSKEGDMVAAPLRFRYMTCDKRQRVVFDVKAGRGTLRQDTLSHQRFRPALEYIELLELVQLAARLDTIYGYPLDIEFGVRRPPAADSAGATDAGVAGALARDAGAVPARAGSEAVMIRREDALDYHGGNPPGLIDVRPAKSCLTAREMRLAYLPGATFASAAIAEDATAAARLSGRGNLVALVTNGTAIPGLGDVGPLAAKPMQEGMALLFKRLADINVFDLELDARDPERFVEVLQALEPGFGGVVLSNVRAPDGLEICERLCATLRIPVLHENLHSTAVVVAAALSNAVDLAGKDIGAVQVVMCGAGTVGLGCARLLLRLGVDPEQLLLYDVRGLLHPDRDDLTSHQRALATAHGAGTLAEALRGADVFIGASVAGVVSEEMVRSMARFPIVFALATPEPEIGYALVRSARRDVIAATALAEYPNALLDLLSFPYIMRGALDVQATRISDGMLLGAARALAELAREEVVDDVSRAYADEHLSFGPEYLLPKGIDPRTLVRESAAVARCAVEEGLARHAVESEPYQESLRVRIGTGRETMRRLMVKARHECPRVVFPEGTHETILRACRILVDEGVARPVLLGTDADVRAALSRFARRSVGHDHRRSGAQPAT